MNIGHALLSIAFMLSPTSAPGRELLSDGDATTTIGLPAAAPAPSKPAPVGAPASTQAVRNAIADAFHASEQRIPCSSDHESVGCTIAETALGSALFDEREEDAANAFLRER